MARRRVSAASGLDELGEAVCAAIDRLSREACPQCGRFTLTAHINMRSGVRIECEGLDPHGDDGFCMFERFVMLSSDRDLPRTDVTAVDAVD